MLVAGTHMKQFKRFSLLARATESIRENVSRNAFVVDMTDRDMDVVEIGVYVCAMSSLLRHRMKMRA